jgi:hypothetical protein
MPLGPARQEQRRPEQISVRRGKGDVVDENVVQPGACHRDFPPYARERPSKCEFDFCRKGLSLEAEIQLAVRRQPVYNPALRCCR